MQLLLQRDAELQEVVQLIGPDALQDSERVVLESSKMVLEDFLQQNAFSNVDGSCDLKKQYRMLATILEFYDLARDAVEKGLGVQDILDLPFKDDISRMKEVPLDQFDEKCDRILADMRREFQERTAAIVKPEKKGRGEEAA
jgi:V/A-type H+-transporting ATPase subunit A